MHIKDIRKKESSCRDVQCPNFCDLSFCGHLCSDICEIAVNFVAWLDNKALCHFHYFTFCPNLGSGAELFK